VSDNPETLIPGPESHADASADTAPADPITETGEGESEPDTFDRDYVQSLRDEAAGYRVKAAKHDETKARLHIELVRATGRVQDPFDVAYNEEHLTDPDKLNADIDALLQAKPHYAARRPVPGTSVGQGVQGDPPKQKVNLIGALRSAHGWA
jgi:hypothetical protein